MSEENNRDKKKKNGPARFGRECPVCNRQNPGHFLANCPETQCYGCGEYGHQAGVCPSPKCYYCGEAGHRQRYCPSRRRTSSSSAGSRSEEGSRTEPEQKEGSGTEPGQKARPSGNKGFSGRPSGSSARGSTKRPVSSRVSGGALKTEVVSFAEATRSTPGEVAHATKVAKSTRCGTLQEHLQLALAGVSGLQARCQDDGFEGRLRGLEETERALRQEYEEKLAQVRKKREQLEKEKEEAERLAAPLTKFLEAFQELSSSMIHMQYPGPPAATVPAGSVPSREQRPTEGEPSGTHRPMDVDHGTGGSLEELSLEGARVTSGELLIAPERTPN